MRPNGSKDGTSSRKCFAAIALAFALFVMLPASAGAATTVGSTFDPSSGGFQCQDNDWQLQTTSPANQYVVPSAGVLTSWSFQAPSSQTPTEVKLEVGRITATSQFFIVGTSPGENPADSTTPTYTDISIPVQAGDLLGMHSNGMNRNCGVLATGYTVNYLGGTNPNPGDTVTTAFTAGLRLDISATLEADCDHDGLGDETE